MTDAANNRVTEIRYDLAGREKEREIREGSEQKYLHDLTYDACGNLVRMCERVSGGEHVTLYDYDRDERLVKSYYGSDAKKTTTSYDALGRVSGKTHYVGSSTGLGESYSYHAGASAYGANAQSALVSGIATPNLTQSYEYDANGNITSFTLNGQRCTYEYDDLGQLIRVNDPMDTYAGSTGTTWVYTYDRGGNITARKVYAYTTGELGTQQGNIAFGYDSVWKDKLTKYLSYTIESDALGNVTKDSNWEFEWEGRRLVKMTGGLTAEFEYDENGQRIRKTSNGVVTNYTVQGKRIVHVNHSVFGNLHIYYDGDRPDAVDYNGTMYGYVYSLQGDVLGLRDSTGAFAVEYRYDAWGRPTSKTGPKANSLGTINPFRYRGYVLDEDVGLYYLRSRYYNPWWGRFISADGMAVLTISPSETMLSDKNLFAYCDNNPIVRSDNSGSLWGWVIGAAIGAVAGIVGQAVSDIVTSILTQDVYISNWQTYAGAAIGGTAAGIVLSTTGNINAANTVSGAVTTGAAATIEKWTISDYDKSWEEIIDNAIIDGMIGNALGRIPGIKKVTQGRNSYLAVYRSGLTKLRNRTAQHMSYKVMAKGLTALMVGGYGMDIYYGQKQCTYIPYSERIALLE